MSRITTRLTMVTLVLFLVLSLLLTSCGSGGTPAGDNSTPGTSSAPHGGDNPAPETTPQETLPSKAGFEGYVTGEVFDLEGYAKSLGFEFLGFEPVYGLTFATMVYTYDNDTTCSVIFGSTNPAVWKSEYTVYISYSDVEKPDKNTDYDFMGVLNSRFGVTDDILLLNTEAVGEVKTITKEGASELALVLERVPNMKNHEDPTEGLSKRDLQ